MVTVTGIVIVTVTVTESELCVSLALGIPIETERGSQKLIYDLSVCFAAQTLLIYITHSPLSLCLSASLPLCLSLHRWKSSPGLLAFLPCLKDVRNISNNIVICLQVLRHNI